MSVRSERRKKAKENVKSKREKTEDAMSQVNGNPQVIAVLEAIQEELDAIEEFLNIEVSE